jgi:phosphoribosylformylglycinamidine synthase PurS subunit
MTTKSGNACARPYLLERAAVASYCPAPMKARVVVMLKKSVLDPQGQAVSRALTMLGFDEVKEVRLGKLIELELAEADPKKARERLAAMCEKLLANLVIEEYRIEEPG